MRCNISKMYVGWTCDKGAEHFGCKWVYWAFLWIDCREASDYFEAKVNEINYGSCNLIKLYMKVGSSQL